MNIVIPDNLNLNDEHIAKLGQLGATVYHDLPDLEQLKERIAEADLITANYVDITPDIIDAAPNLQYIIVPAVGYEWVDVVYARSKGIAVINSPTHNSQSVAEHALGLALAVNRKLLTAAASLRDGHWTQDEFTGTEIQGKKVGIIGHGNIGTRIEILLNAFGAETSFTNSKSTPEELETLVRNVDILFIAAPLTSATKNLMNARRLSLLKPTAVLINVARGAIVDEEALYDLLIQNKIAGAGLDVFCNEPMSGPAPDQAKGIAQLSNVVATAHIASHTKESTARLAEEVISNIEACLSGNPKNIVN